MEMRSNKVKFLGILGALLLIMGCEKAAAFPTSRSIAAVPTPIKYIIVLIQENHTFDSYFTGFPGATSSATATLSNGMILERPQAPDGPLRSDLCHSHNCARKAYHAGAMDGLDHVRGAVAPSGSTRKDYLAYIRYTEDQIPNYWQYARNFVLADHFFQTTLSNSFSGHFALISGFNVGLANTSCTCVRHCTMPQYDPATGMITQAPACWDYPSVVFHLPSGFTWTEYGGSTLMHDRRILALPDRAKHFQRIASFRSDLSTPSQANLIFVHGSEKDNEHPPKAVCPGENETVEILNKIMSGPHWRETAVLLTWDDWGGFYDSVSPEAPQLNGDYFSPGFRLPLIIISPYAKKGYVLKTKTEQASVVRLIEDLWGLPRMASEDPRIHDATVGSLLGAFDFRQQPRKPLILRPRNCHSASSVTEDEEDE